jgi:hypothetical protein
MKRPMPRGSAIDMARMARWAADFTGYRTSVTEPRIDRWIEQFRVRDRDLAARILDSVEFITREQITTAFRSILNTLPGWNIEERFRQGRWRFVPFTASAGESGDTMLHQFRLANNMASKKFNELFIYKSDLLKQALGPDDKVVFVDDFSGSGKQVCDEWPIIEELLPDNPNIYLVLVAATARAVSKIEKETNLTPVPYSRLDNSDNIFSPSSRHFTPAEKQTILDYCKRVDSRKPQGFGDCGLVVVLAHNCPNNSIPILHINRPSWEGLFRRHD